VTVSAVLVRALVALVAGPASGLGLAAVPAIAQSPPATSPVRDSLPLRPGDLIRLRVWREPDMSGDFLVNEAGIAVLPEIGPMEVTRGPADKVEASIIRELSTYLNHPSIDLALLRRVQVAGAVEKPGLYHIDPTMTIGDAIALAGGVSGSGRTDKVEILRAGQKLPGSVSGRSYISQTPVRSGDQLYVPERSWISRNPGVILAFLSTITVLIYTVRR
jgi:protein involved in polysaccharide export with SLBB domain